MNRQREPLSSIMSDDKEETDQVQTSCSCQRSTRQKGWARLHVPRNRVPSLGTVCSVNPSQFLEVSARLMAVIRRVDRQREGGGLEGGGRVRGGRGEGERGEGGGWEGGGWEGGLGSSPHCFIHIIHSFIVKYGQKAKLQLLTHIEAVTNSFISHTVCL